MRCPGCGALNPDTAAWCGQCYQDLAVAPTQGSPPPDGPAAVPAGAGRGRDVREVDGRLEWRCRACDSWNALEAPDCGGCGAPRTGFGEFGRPPVHSGRAWPSSWLLGLTVVAPGLGHILAGRLGTGLARLTLTLVWLTGAIGIIGAADAVPFAGVVLIMGVAAVWVASILDMRLLLAGEPAQTLDARRLLWLVVGVTVVLLVAMSLTGALR